CRPRSTRSVFRLLLGQAETGGDPDALPEPVVLTISRHTCVSPRARARRSREHKGRLPGASIGELDAEPVRSDEGARRFNAKEKVTTTPAAPRRGIQAEGTCELVVVELVSRPRANRLRTDHVLQYCNCDRLCAGLDRGTRGVIGAQDPARVLA